MKELIKKASEKHNRSIIENEKRHKEMIDSLFNHMFGIIKDALDKNQFPFSIKFFPKHDSNKSPRMSTPLLLEFDAYIMNGTQRNEIDKPLLMNILNPIGIRDSMLYNIDGPIWIAHTLFGKKAIAMLGYRAEVSKEHPTHEYNATQPEK
jgi:hypothetical protein